MSQTTEILEHLKTGSSITAIEALKLFSCFRLAARIKDLRDEGYVIFTTNVKEGDKHFAQYTLLR